MSDTKGVDVFTALNKKYGEGTVKFGKDVTARTISTGLLSFDKVIGRTGIPRGRVVEFYGPPSGGKSTLALHCIAEAQKEGIVCVYIDMENAYDDQYAQVLGVDTEALVLIEKGATQLRSGEHALDAVESLVSSGQVGLIVIDSVPALTPQSDLEGEMLDQSMATLARLMSKALPRLTDIAASNKCTLLFINQIRHKIGFVMGNPETTPGGNALMHYASIRVAIRKGEILTINKVPVGQIVKIKTVKNKVTNPLQEAAANLMWGTGFDRIADLVEVAIQEELVIQSGAWIKYKGEKYQGKLNFCKFLQDNPNEVEAIRKEVLSEKTNSI